MRSYSTKRIELPGGRFVEVVVFDDPGTPETIGPGAPDRETTAPSRTGLHICSECESDMVYPVTWEECHGNAWEITLRCPDCEHWHTGEYSGDVVDQFDDALNDGTEQLLSDLRTFARVNMEEDVERFVRAIDQDLILPMDF